MDVEHETEMCSSQPGVLNKTQLCMDTALVRASPYGLEMLLRIYLWLIWLYGVKIHAHECQPSWMRRAQKGLKRTTSSSVMHMFMTCAVPYREPGHAKNNIFDYFTNYIYTASGALQPSTLRRCTLHCSPLRNEAFTA